MQRITEWLKEWLKKWGGRLLGLALLAWVVQLASEQWDELPPLEDISWLPFALGWALVGIGHLLLIRAWQSVLRWLGVVLPYRDCFSIFSISMLGRYLPGKIMVIVGKVAMLQQKGVKKSTTLYSIGWELGLIALAAGLLCVAPAQAAIDADYPVWLLGYGAAALFGVLLLGTAVYAGWRSSRALVGILAQYLGFWLLLGTGFLSLSHSLASFPFEEGVVPIIRAYGIVHMASIAIIVVPGGLGVRELGLQWALAGTVIGPISALVAVLMRAVVTSFEIGYATIGLSLRRHDAPDQETKKAEELSVADSAPTD